MHFVATAQADLPSGFIDRRNLSAFANQVE